MPDQFNNSASATVPRPTPAPEPLLQNKIPVPKGVLQKNLKMLVYLGAAGVLIAASILSSKGKQPVKTGTKGGPPQPFVQDTTDNNVQALRSQVEAERSKQQQDAALMAATGAGANRINPLTGAQYRPGTYLAADTQPGQGSYGTSENPTCSSLLPYNKRKCRSRARIESWRTAPFSLRVSLTADRNSSNTNKEKHKRNRDKLGQIKAQPKTLQTFSTRGRATLLIRARPEIPQRSSPQATSGP
jgi:hypothetical protein